MRPLTVLDEDINVDLGESKGSYVKLMRMCKNKTQSNSPMTSPAENIETEQVENVPFIIKEIVKQPIVHLNALSRGST